LLAEVETDKATMELVARGSGVLRRRLLGEGDTASVGTLIAVIAGADEDISGIVSEAAPAGAAAPKAEAPAAEPAKAAEPAVATAAQPAAAAAVAAPAGDADGRLRASPLARRLAAESGLELREIQGTG